MKNPEGKPGETWINTGDSSDMINNGGLKCEIWWSFTKNGECNDGVNIN